MAESGSAPDRRIGGHRVDNRIGNTVGNMDGDGGAATDAATGSGLGLPGWVYSDQRFYQREVEQVLLPSWQVVCHVNDIPQPGDYWRLDFLGRPIFVVRGDDGEVRAFYNVCRHRAARLLDGDMSSAIDGPGDGSGRCQRGRITCPYHGWTYDLCGRLIGMPRASSFPGLERGDWSLKSPQLEIWQGFVFVRCEGDGPGIAEMMAPWAELLAGYRMPQMRALGRLTLRPREVNWKTVVENYADGLHIDVVHRGLSALSGGSYHLQAGQDVMHMSANLDPERASGSGRLYCRVLPDATHLPPTQRRRWNYLLLWPNLAFDLYPDQVDFMQMIPLGPGRTLIREIPYGLDDNRREMHLARYLNWRINRQVNREDTGLIERVQAGMDSGVFTQGPLSKDEVCLRALAERLRLSLPEASLASPPWSAGPDDDPVRT